MGLFDSVLGTKTNDATAQAAQQVGANNLDTVINNSNTLNSQYGQANNALTTGATNATNAINNGYANATGALTGYNTQALDTLNNGTQGALSTVLGSNSQYSPYVSSGQAASGMLSNALGLNGQSGNDAATSAFQSSPGYQYSVDQATDQAARKAASLGMAASGNTLTAINTQAQNLANQDYQQWLTNLNGVGSQGLSAANAVTGNNATAGGYQYGAGTTGANLLNTTGTNLGTLDAAQGNNLGTIQTGLGTALSSNDTSLGTNLANNNWMGTLSTDNATLQNGKAQDAADSANNGILSNLLGSFLAPVTSTASNSVSGALKTATGGFL